MHFLLSCRCCAHLPGSVCWCRDWKCAGESHETPQRLQLWNGRFSLYYSQIKYADGEMSLHTGQMSEKLLRNCFVTAVHTEYCICLVEKLYKMTSGKLVAYDLLKINRTGVFLHLFFTLSCWWQFLGTCN